jgi:hypothetical protein
MVYSGDFRCKRIKIPRGYQTSRRRRTEGSSSSDWSSDQEEEKISQGNLRPPEGSSEPEVAKLPTGFFEFRFVVISPCSALTSNGSSDRDVENQRFFDIR